MGLTEHRNILIIKPSALGDIVHALPVVSSLRTSFPKAKLTWLVRKEFAPLLECVEGLDKILLFDRKGMAKWFLCPKAFRCLCDFRKQLREGEFDLVLDFQGLFRSAVFAKMTGCANRVGMRDSREFARLFYTHRVDRPNGPIHFLDYYFEILKKTGVQRCLPDCVLTAPAEAKDSIRKKLNDLGLAPKKFLALIPSSAHSRKCWPTERFAHVANEIHRRYGWDAVVLGTQSESIYAKKIQANTASPVIDFTGQTSIPELVALFDLAGGVISNDTGPGHIAMAAGTPGVIIYGNTNPLRVGPYQRLESVVAIEAEKRGIEIKDTNPAHGIEKVTVDMVLEKINAQFGKESL